MKLKTKIILVIVFLIQICEAQNWDIFNKNYRYNYKYNNSILISNVLFADSVKQIGSDTIYKLNRIGVECTGTCPAYSGTLNSGTNYVLSNMPQFLQRNIIKYQNGIVKLYDTTKIVILPNCNLSQTWLFDSIYNKSALCVAINTLSIFGTIDSVKTILINLVDTLKFSKSFGIIVFPDIYGKNKYFRLVGIENRNSYDSLSLFGQKVPNAWDIYNYNVGDQYCYTSSGAAMIGPNGSGDFDCNIGKVFINSKTITPTGYIYGVTNIYNFAIGMYPVYCSIYSANTNSSSLSFTNLNTPIIENKMYPNMLLNGNIQSTSNFAFNNITKFKLDNNNVFYKTAGRGCSTYTNPNIPVNANIKALSNNYNNTPTAIFTVNNFGSDEASIIFGVGFGKITSRNIFFEHNYTYCLTCFTKNNVTYFGQSYPVNLSNVESNNSNFSIYPNPFIDKIYLKNNEKEIKNIELFIYSIDGRLVFSNKINSSDLIDLSYLNTGIYILELKSNTGKFFKRIIKE